MYTVVPWSDVRNLSIKLYSERYGEPFIAMDRE